MKLRILLVLISLGCLPLAGCGTRSVEFTQNKIAARAGEIQGGFEESMPREVYQQIADILGAVFGTPDDPKLIAGGAEQGFVSEGNLLRSAGPVSNRRLSGDIEDVQLAQGQGLYRQHCVHCHGINGDGKGPTAAFLNPYPRDFTLGKFKFNSTRIGQPSTHEDIHRILMNGVNGTAMPSFALLDRGEIESLVEYVKYLSVRGQSERFLILMATELDLEGGESIEVTPEVIIGSPDDEGISAIVESWKTAEAVAPEEPSVPIVTTDPASWTEEEKEAVYASVDRGRQLYYTAKANCYSCHGNTQLGDGNLGLYDDWTKELYNWQSEPDEDGSKKAEYVTLGGFKPRIIRPRNLRLGLYRGGNRPIDIYWRIFNGIDGAGMPAANGLSNDEIWDLVNYVLYLPYEHTTTSDDDLPSLDRPRD